MKGLRALTIKQAALFGAAFVLGISGYGGHSSAVSLAQHDTARDPSVTSRGPHWQRAPRWVRELAECVIRHESLNAGHYRAENPTSTASGAYQMIDSTWRGNARYVAGAAQYSRAKYAPPRVQDRVFIHSIMQGGASNWRGTGCPTTS